MKNEFKNIITKYNLIKTDKEKDGFYGVMYSYKLNLKNLNTTWFINFEGKTRKCKFYSIFTRFDNKEMLSKIDKTIPCNTWSGKCNRFVYSLEEIENFINNVIFFDKYYKEQTA